MTEALTPPAVELRRWLEKWMREIYAGKHPPRVIDWVWNDLDGRIPWNAVAHPMAQIPHVLPREFLEPIADIVRGMQAHEILRTMNLLAVMVGLALDLYIVAHMPNAAAPASIN